METCCSMSHSSASLNPCALWTTRSMSIIMPEIQPTSKPRSSAEQPELTASPELTPAAVEEHYIFKAIPMLEKEEAAGRGVRPVVIWFTGILVLLYAVELMRRAAAKLIHHEHFPLGVVRPFIFIALSWMVAIGLFRRWKWSRWVAVVSLVAWGVYSYWVSFSVTNAKLGEGWTVTAIVPVIIVGFVVSSLILLIASLVAFQPKVSRYFDSNSRS